MNVVHELKKNGTPFQKASMMSINLVLDAVPVALTVGGCSCVVDSILASFDATKDMPDRRNIAVITSLSVLTILYISYKYEEMQKSEEEKKS